MSQRCLTSPLHGPLRLRVSSVHAGRSSGGSTAYRSERSGSFRDRPWAGRGNRGREDEQRDERRYGDQGGGESGGGRGYSTYRPGKSGEQSLWEGERRRRGSDGDNSNSRRERLVSEAATAAGNQRRQQKSYGTAAQQQQQHSKLREREEYGNEEDDREYDAEYDDVAHEDAEEGDERRGPDGRRGNSSAAVAGPCLRDTLQGEALYGVFPVLAALRTKRRQVHRAFMLSSMDLSKRKDAGLVRQVEAMCTEAGVEVVRTGRHELNLMSYDRPHQGLVLDVSPLGWASLDEFPPADEVMAAAVDAVHGGGAGTAVPPVWLALDEVVDPQNLGAVIRSAYCLGAAGVLACSRNCAPLSPVVSKASAGALEAIQLHTCRNLPRTLMDARDLKSWAVLGAAAGSGSEPVGRITVDRPTILVLGSEGFGLRTNVRRACSGLVRVDMALATTARTASTVSLPRSGNDAEASTTTLRQPPLPRQQQHAVLRGLVDSLNVSVATGILLHSLINSAAAAAAEPTGATTAIAGATAAGPADTAETEVRRMAPTAT